MAAADPLRSKQAIKTAQNLPVVIADRMSARLPMTGDGLEYRNMETRSPASWVIVPTLSSAPSNPVKAGIGLTASNSWGGAGWN